MMKSSLISGDVIDSTPYAHSPL